MLKIAIGQSEEPETQEALKEVLSKCREVQSVHKPQAGLLFASAGYDFPLLVQELAREYPGIQIAGCSSFGEISTREIVGGNSVALMLLESDEIEMLSVLAKEIGQQERSAVLTAINQVLKDAQAKPALCLAFADSLSSNVTDIIEGIKEAVGDPTLIVAGGGACDDWEFKKVYVFSEGQSLSNAASLLLLSEPLKSSIAVRHGRRPLPLKTRHMVTKSDKNVVFTIDNMSALDFYKSQLGEYANYEAYALLIYLDDPEQQPDKYLIRAPFQINRETGAIAFPGDVPQNCFVGISQLSNKGQTLEAARECVKKARETFKGNKIDAALVFSCALRKEILGTDTYKEWDIIKSELPKEVPLFGYYTFGEIGQSDMGEPTKYFNETIVTVLIGV